MIILTGDATGRLLRYDPATGAAAFPDGVALSADGTHLVVAETARCRLLRHWLRGPRAGATEPFADLPGYPESRTTCASPAGTAPPPPPTTGWR